MRGVRSRTPRLLLLVLCAGAGLAPGALALECKPEGTAFERNFCATLAAERAERELDAALAAARARHTADPNALAALTAAHAAWLHFRDAALAAAFPCHHDDLSVCFDADTPRRHALFRARLARERAAHLEGP